MDKTEGRRCATKQKETEEQLLKPSYNKALLIEPFVMRRLLRSPLLLGIMML